MFTSSVCHAFFLPSSLQVYLDLDQGDYQWEQPVEVVSPKKCCYVTLVDLEEAVSKAVHQETHSRQVSQTSCDSV